MLTASTVPTNGLMGREGKGELEMIRGESYMLWRMVRMGMGMEKERCTPVFSHMLKVIVTAM